MCFWEHFSREGNEGMTFPTLQRPDETRLSEVSEASLPSVLDRRLGHLATLEGESIYILREAFARLKKLESEIVSLRKMLKRLKAEFAPDNEEAA